MGYGLKGYGDCSEEVLRACPVEMALHMIGGKWKGTIIEILSEKSFRFNELKRFPTNADFTAQGTRSGWNCEEGGRRHCATKSRIFPN